MNKVKVTKVIYKVFLWCFFIYAIINSLRKVLREETVFDESKMKGVSAKPCVTFCRFLNPELKHYNFTTMEEIVESINDHKHSLTVFFNGINLTDPLELAQHWQVGPSVIWSYGIKVGQGEKLFDPCATLCLKYLRQDQVDEEDEVVFNLMPLEPSDHQRMEIHAEGQSNHNYKLSLGSGITFLPVRTGMTMGTKLTETIALKKSTYDCNEDNSVKQTDCINEYLEQKLECLLPWLHTNSDSLVCSGSEKYTHLWALYQNLLQNKSVIEHCFKPNCHTLSWEDAYKSTWSNQWGPRKINVRMKTNPSSHAIKRKEIVLFSWASFFADIGSYLGLFLGGSIMSLTDWAASTVKKLKSLIATKKKDSLGSEAVQDMTYDQSGIERISVISVLPSVETKIQINSG